MDIISLIKKVKKEEESLDVQEAFNIYNLLKTRYVSNQTVQLFKNFVHDVDYEQILDKFQKDFENQINILEELGRKFRIVMPNRPPVDIKFATKINDVTDDYIYKTIYHDLVAQLLFLIQSVRSTGTNDNLRNIFVKDLIIHLEEFDTLYRFGKKSGWEETYPNYKTSINQKKEQLSAPEAFHIWDHITMRYEQTELLGTFFSFIHDADFKVILQHGLNIYNNQINTLEQIAMKLNVPLPNRPALPVTSPIDPEIITDRFVYRIVLNMEFTSLESHVTAIIETIKNEELRKLWFEILTTELEYCDKYMKYGKMKGWTRVIPIYGEPVT